ncbi:hypothetical protein AVEN_76155-1 [Araneus ventricosus]|uniref:Uncharacterized protein n=1 Tax=Araneus ventricosus TaxID=182803 RepID=A0A4Y2E9J4_ARAVE|nr:hypothetical protein AVEN_76155-1 [Araneus ventricosus]
MVYLLSSYDYQKRYYGEMSTENHAKHHKILDKKVSLLNFKIRASRCIESSLRLPVCEFHGYKGIFQLPLNIRIAGNEKEVIAVKPVSVHRCRRNQPPESDFRVSYPSTRLRHWRNSVRPGTFSGAGTDSSRKEQHREYRLEGQAAPSSP